MDSATFMSFIDRVGSSSSDASSLLYGPMASRCPWMRFLEESYHLAAGETLMKAIAVAGSNERRQFRRRGPSEDVEHWYPEGLEMFGLELAGDLVKASSDAEEPAKLNRSTSDEVLGKVRDVNLAIIQAKTRCPRGEAEAILRRITEKGETVQGLTKRGLVFLPDRRFFRIRVLAEFGDYRMPRSDAAGVGYVYLPYDVHGNC